MEIGFRQGKDFHVGEEEKIKKDIEWLRRELNRPMRTFERVRKESLLKEKEKRLLEMGRLRTSFTFNEDIIDHNEYQFPIDKLMRDRIKDENYKGFIHTVKCNEMIEKIPEKK